MNTINTTVASDNSSDSASHSKKTNKSEIEIVDQKIIKCINEINYLKHKIQREWSKQMNNHLKSFYNDDGSSSQNDSMNSNNLSSSVNNSTPQQSTNPSDSSECEKKISLLSKKLKSYEKRRQKILYDTKKAQDSVNATSANSQTAPNTTNDSIKNSTNDNKINGSNKNESLHQLSNDKTISNNNDAITNNNHSSTIASNVPTVHLTPVQINPANPLSNLQNKIRNNNGSFIMQAYNNNINNKQTTGTIGEDTLNLSQAKSTNMLNADENKPPGAASFYLNADSNFSNVKLNTQNNIENLNNTNGDLTIDDANKSSFDRNMIFLQFEQQIYFLKLQQEKVQSDLEEIQKKIQENQQILMKELQHTCNQISEPVHKLSFNLYKSYDQKLEELKSTFDRSVQSISYNLSHVHRDIKETKDDVTYMKNRMEILEKSQKVNNIEANPTNYYQLFYKLLDILLTLATIILLAFTNMIASIKFIFLLYPRTIVVFLFMYFLVFYLVDFDKLDVYFHQLLLNDVHFSKLKSHNYESPQSSNNNLTYLSKIFQSVYNFINIFKSSSSSNSPKGSSSS